MKGLGPLCVDLRLVLSKLPTCPRMCPGGNPTPSGCPIPTSQAISQPVHNDLPKEVEMWDAFN